MCILSSIRKKIILQYTMRRIQLNQRKKKLKKEQHFLHVFLSLFFFAPRCVGVIREESRKCALPLPLLFLLSPPAAHSKRPVNVTICTGYVGKGDRERAEEEEEEEEEEETPLWEVSSTQTYRRPPTARRT